MEKAWRRRQIHSATWCGGFHLESGMAFTNWVRSLMALCPSLIRKTGTSEHCTYLNTHRSDLALTRLKSVLDADENPQSETGSTVQMHNSVHSRNYNFYAEKTFRVILGFLTQWKSCPSSDSSRYCHHNSGPPLKTACPSEDMSTENRMTTSSLRFTKPCVPHARSLARSFEKQTRPQMELLWNFANICYKSQHSLVYPGDHSNRKRSI